MRVCGSPRRLWHDLREVAGQEECNVLSRARRTRQI